MKKLLLCMIIALSLSSLVSCGKNRVKREDQFIVAMECAYSPFNWTETRRTETNYPIQGTRLYADGYDVQIAKKIAEGMGKTLVIKALDWRGLIPALQNDQIDAVIAGMSPTEERKLSVDFTNAYYTSTHVLVMSKDSKYLNGKTLNDFAGANVVGQKDTLYDTLIDQLVGANHQTPLQDVPTIITALNSKRSDITILEEPVAKGVITANPDYTYIKVEGGFNVTEDQIAVSIALKKGSAIREQINNVLAGITEEERITLMMAAVERAQ